MLKQLVSLGLLGVGACALSAMPSLKKHPLEVKFTTCNFAIAGFLITAPAVKIPSPPSAPPSSTATASSWICR